MNRFVLHEDPVAAAQMHCDKHVVKMILEEAQMLSTAHRLIDSFVGHTYVPEGKTRHRTEYYFDPGDDRESLLYRVTHANHPCSAWARVGGENYDWAWRLLSALCDEYTYRYGRVHRVRESGLERALRARPRRMAERALTAHPTCMPDEYKTSDVVESYRNFYRVSKSRFAVWARGRAAPDWYARELTDA